MTTTISDQLDANAGVSPDGIWLQSPETSDTVSWANAAEKSKSIANNLDTLGLAENAVVAIAAPNSIWSTLCFTGVTYGGYTALPLNLVAGARVISYVLGHSKASVILCADESWELIEDALKDVPQDITIIRIDPESGPQWPGTATTDTPTHRPTPDTIGLLMYTSGTTGMPKGVIHTHSSLTASGMNVVIGHDLVPDDTAMCILPIYHINGLCVTVLGTLMSRSSLAMPGRFSVRQFWKQAHDCDVSWFSAVPTHFAYLLNEEAAPVINHDRLRFARSASSPLPPEIHRRFEEQFGTVIIETMGLTETGAQILSNPMPPKQAKVGSPGIAVGNEIMIGDDNQKEVARGVTGEILICGDNVMQGYLHNPEETAKTITPDGWLRSGDLGHMDEDGYVFVTGRIKELIIKGGENIAPREVDEVLLEHASILEAAAFAVPCDQYGQRVEACIKFKTGQNAEEGILLEHCAAQLGKFKSPDKLHVMDDLPKGPSGKVQRLKLHEMIYG